MKPSHIIVLIIVLLLLFGASKLPDIAKSLGQSAKVLKKEMKELQEDDSPGQSNHYEGQALPSQAASVQQPNQPASGNGQDQATTMQYPQQQPYPQQPGSVPPLHDENGTQTQP